MEGEGEEDRQGLSVEGNSEQERSTRNEALPQEQDVVIPINERTKTLLLAQSADPPTRGTGS